MILGLFLFVIGSIVLFTVVLGLFSADSIVISYKNQNLQFGQTPVILFKNAIVANLIFIIFGGSLLVFAALLISHQIAGPQYHLEKFLKNMIDGNLKETIRLRAKDEGSTLAAQINTFNSMLSNKISEIDKQAQTIEELVNQADLSTMEQKTLLDNYRLIGEHIQAIRDVTSSFTLADV